MRYRQLPPVGDLTDLESVYLAVPRDADETADCCRRLCRRTTVETRTHASQWLVFLTAVGCVSDDGAGYYRQETTLDAATLGDEFVSHVFGVPAVLAVFEATDRALTRDEVANRIDGRTRDRLERTDPGPVYLDRVLGWAVTLGQLTIADNGYMLSTTA
ncbi:hypothetical protein ACFQJ7_15630 [Halovenus rubra]|uniref:Uncharacterized protein n=2 Tax=Halovenus rubra TaxID=869890 RepID=A0ACC7E1R7_9EURY|nr:hypothetical protein [Halovenus rubra]